MARDSRLLNALRVEEDAHRARVSMVYLLQEQERGLALREADRQRREAELLWGVVAAERQWAELPAEMVAQQAADRVRSQRQRMWALRAAAVAAANDDDETAPMRSPGGLVSAAWSALTVRTALLKWHDWNQAVCQYLVGMWNANRTWRLSLLKRAWRQLCAPEDELCAPDDHEDRAGKHRVSGAFNHWLESRLTLKAALHFVASQLRVGWAVLRGSRVQTISSAVHLLALKLLGSLTKWRTFAAASQKKWLEGAHQHHLLMLRSKSLLSWRSSARRSWRESVLEAMATQLWTARTLSEGIQSWRTRKLLLRLRIGWIRWMKHMKWAKCCKLGPLPLVLMMIGELEHPVCSVEIIRNAEQKHSWPSQLQSRGLYHAAEVISSVLLLVSADFVFELAVGVQIHAKRFLNPLMQFVHVFLLLSLLLSCCYRVVFIVG